MSEVDVQLQRRGLVRSGNSSALSIDFEDGSKRHPRNWPLLRRGFDTSVITFFQFMTTAMSTAGTSLGSKARDDYGLTRTTSIVVFVLTYQLGRIVGSITLPPCSETFGRKPTYVMCGFVYFIMTLIAGVVPHVSGAIIGRLFSGIASAASGGVAAGSIQDMYNSEARIWVFFAWTTGSTVGLSVGPIYGSYVADALGWYVE